MQNQNRKFAGKTKGFTLVETLIVIILIGVIAGIIYPLVNNLISSKANAQEMQSVSQNIVRSISMMQQTMRIPSVVTGNPVTAAGNNLLDAVVSGDKVAGIIAPAYAARYTKSGVRPMSDALTITTQPAAGTPGVYTIGDSTISLNAISARSIGVVLTNVPTELLLSIYEERIGGTAPNTAAALNTGTVRWTAASAAGTHTMTLVYDL